MVALELGFNLPTYFEWRVGDEFCLCSALGSDGIIRKISRGPSLPFPSQKQGARKEVGGPAYPASIVIPTLALGPLIPVSTPIVTSLTRYIVVKKLPVST
jgi:hypothetical protein